MQHNGILTGSPMLVPLLLLVVAVTQMRCAFANNLTPWKGGGFGMFATMDTPGNRFLVMDGQDNLGRRYLVRTVPSRALTTRSALSSAFLAQTLAMPTVQRAELIAAALLEARLMAAPPPVLSNRLITSELGAILAPPLATMTFLENASPWVPADALIRLRTARVRIIRLTYRRSSADVTTDTLTTVTLGALVDR